MKSSQLILNIEIESMKQVIRNLEKENHRLRSKVIELREEIAIMKREGVKTCEQL